MRQAAYLHIPFCRRRCFYCDFPISVVGDRATGDTSSSMAEYVDWLCAEIIATPKDLAPLTTVFFGGGTPSLLSPQQVEQILLQLDRSIGIQHDAEISMEMDPGTFSQTKLQALCHLGLNRISLGVQAFQDSLLARCGRSHRVSDIHHSIEMLHQVQVENFSIDLISGLPGQSEQDWEASLTQAIQIRPTHLSCYDMVLEPMTVFGKRDQKGALDRPEEAIAAQMYRQASHQLRAAGYDHYEISNYARPGYQCCHNLTYWNNEDFYGFGMGAASYHHHRRISRPRTRLNYYQWVQQLQHDPVTLLAQTPRLEHSDRQFESLMVGMRLASGVQLNALGLTHATQQILYQSMQPYIQRGWVRWHETSKSARVQLTDPEGYLYSNQVLVSLWEALDHACC